MLLNPYIITKKRMHILHFQGGPTKYGLHPHFYRKIFILSPLWFFKNLNSPINKDKGGGVGGRGCIDCRGIKSLNILGEWPSDLKFYSWDQTVCTHTRTHTNTYTHTHTHTHKHTHKHTHIVCVYVYVCVFGAKKDSG